LLRIKIAKPAPLTPSLEAEGSPVGDCYSNNSVFAVFGEKKGCLRRQTIGNYTPQEPPYPIVTFSPSTITGTFLMPFE